MDKCAYCHKEVLSPHPVKVEKRGQAQICCSETCVEKTLSFYNYFMRTKVYFFIGLAISMVLLFVSVILLSLENLFYGSIFMGASIFLLGLLILLLPFATPETFKLFGIKKAVLIVRFLGIGVMLLGLVLVYFLRA